MKKLSLVNGALIAVTSMLLISSFNPSMLAREERGIRTHQIERQGVNPRVAPEQDRALRGATTTRAYEAGEVRGANVSGGAVNGAAVNGAATVDPTVVQPTGPSVNVTVQPPQR